MNIKTKLEKLEAQARENSETGEVMKTPSSYTFVPERRAKIRTQDDNELTARLHPLASREAQNKQLEKLEADERARQDRPTGVIFIPWSKIAAL